MNDLQGIPPKFARQLALARERLTVADEVGLALRDHRRALGLSQRAYAASRGLSRAMLARLEAGAGRMSLDTVVAALEGTGFELRVTFDDPPPTTPGAAEAVPSTSAHESGSPEAVLSASSQESDPPEAGTPTSSQESKESGSRQAAPSTSLQESGSRQAAPSTSSQESDPPQAVPSPSSQESGSPEDVGIPPQAWLATDLVARVRGGSRRFPAHRVVIPVTDPPMWWWVHEFFSGPTEKPQWYAPEPAYDPFSDWESSADDPSSGAA